MIKTLLSNIEFYEKLKDDFTYHSSAIEGSTLTYEDNKTAIDHPDTVKPEQFPNKYKHDELQENINCGVLFDYVISTINERLNERELKIWHNILKKNTKWAHNNMGSYGDYKKIINAVGGEDTPQPLAIPQLMNNWFKEFNKIKQWTPNSIALFHCTFEWIHPFLDGNGRIGRFILLKQCLQDNIDLFVINNNSRNEYLNTLKMYRQTKSEQFLSQYILKLQKMFKVIYARFLGKQYNDNEAKIIDYISAHNSITRKQTESLLNLSLSGANKVIQGLVNKKAIERHNGSRNIIYKLIG